MRAVTSTGGLIAQAGTRSIALAASHHATPVVVLTGMYKLTPIPHPFDYHHPSFNVFMSPAAIMPYNEAGTLHASSDSILNDDQFFEEKANCIGEEVDSGLDDESVEIAYPYFDFVSPSLISLFVTNV